MVLPLLLLVLALCAQALQAGVTKIRCVDAARAAARELARGEDLAGARATASLIAPGARVSVVTDGDLVRVVVADTVDAGVPGLATVLSLHVEGSAIAAREASGGPLGTMTRAVP